jgi:peptidoglycan hydrolase-like amidase
MFRLAVIVPLIHFSLWAGDVRIGVLSTYQPKRLVITASSGAGLALRTGDSVRDLAPGETVTLSAMGRLVRCGTTTTQTANVEGLSGGPVEFILAVPGKIERTYSGTLEVSVAAGNLQPVVSTGIESAVASAIFAESAPNTPFEALKALAIAARSYYFALRHAHAGFDFCDTTHCQFFRSMPKPAHPAARAARETAGMVITWHGAPVATRYFSACGGRTHSLKDIWQMVESYPFHSVACVSCGKRHSSWSSSMGAADAAPLLALPGSERVRIEVIQRLGVRALPSNTYTYAREGDRIVFHGKGFGHGVGLCQAGSCAMAAEGAKFAEIVRHYFPGTSIQADTTTTLRAGVPRH